MNQHLIPMDYSNHHFSHSHLQDLNYFLLTPIIFFFWHLNTLGTLVRRDEDSLQERFENKCQMIDDDDDDVVDR